MAAGKDKPATYSIQEIRYIKGKLRDSLEGAGISRTAAEKISSKVAEAHETVVDRAIRKKDPVLADRLLATNARYKEFMDEFERGTLGEMLKVAPEQVASKIKLDPTTGGDVTSFRKAKEMFYKVYPKDVAEKKFDEFSMMVYQQNLKFLSADPALEEALNAAGAGTAKEGARLANAFEKADKLLYGKGVSSDFARIADGPRSKEFVKNLHDLAELTRAKVDGGDVTSVWHAMHWLHRAAGVMSDATITGAGIGGAALLTPGVVSAIGGAGGAIGGSILLSKILQSRTATNFLIDGIQSGAVAKLGEVVANPRSWQSFFYAVKEATKTQDEDVDAAQAKWEKAQRAKIQQSTQGVPYSPAPQPR
jgi:hypothetical protein